MKKAIVFCLLIFALYSCTKYKGIWEDNIHLSTKNAEFSALGDSIIITTKGSWWWISNISVIAVDTSFFYNFKDVNMQADYYVIKQDCFYVEHRDNHTLFIKIAPNPYNVKRIIGVGFEAGDYFDGVTVTQRAK